MSCTKSRLLRIALWAALVLGLAYGLVPELRGWIATAAPTLLALVCPLMMLVCRRGMHKDAAGGTSPKAEPIEQTPVNGR